MSEQQRARVLPSTGTRLIERQQRLGYASGLQAAMRAVVEVRESLADNDGAGAVALTRVLERLDELRLAVKAEIEAEHAR